MPSSFPPGHWQTFAALWTYCPQLTTRGPPPCCRCGDPGAASRLEATVRMTQPHLASFSGGRPWPTELWPCICLEEGSYLWRLAVHCGHSNAPAEYAIKEEEKKQRFEDFRSTLTSWSWWVIRFKLIPQVLLLSTKWNSLTFSKTECELSSSHARSY